MRVLIFSEKLGGGFTEARGKILVVEFKKVRKGVELLASFAIEVRRIHVTIIPQKIVFVIVLMRECSYLCVIF
jgi:hypothetical protein